MKKIVILLVVLIILILTFTGCEKPEPPAPPAVFYTLSTSVIGKGSVSPDKLSGIPLGSSIKIKFISELGYAFYSAKENGLKVEELKPSTTEVEHTIKDINRNPNVEATFVETSNLLISRVLNPNPWKYKAMDIYKDDGTLLFTFPLSQEEKNRNKYFYFNYPNTNYVEIIGTDGVRTFYADWSVSQNILRVDATKYTIVELTPTRLVFKAPPGADPTTGIINYAQYTFERN